MDDENRILTQGEFAKMSADLDRELEGRDYHGEMKDALDFAMKALNNVSSEFFWDNYPGESTARTMNEIAQKALVELINRGFWK